MAKKPLNIGMIGYGFMGRTHSNAYCKVGHFFDLEYQPVLKAACARNEENIQKFADNWGYESIETDWRALVARDDIDAVDICVPNNLHKEIAIFADRCDISEELGRLRSHILLFDNVMDNEEPNGRKLEFIVQEMFREANTIASKANNSDIIKDVISIKTEIERMKEQILNLE